MDDRQTILEQYRIYNESKDKFIDRNFVVNRFYLIIALVLMILVSGIHQATGTSEGATSLILCVAGIGVSMLWWLNQDAYSLLIKVKYAFVLEKMEEKLASNPNNMEFKGLAEFQQKRKAFLFSDIQKGLAVLALLGFMVFGIFGTAPHLVKMVLAMQAGG